ncbi:MULTISPECIES: hypothetical protein [unclassified Saccharopolyspora]|uniref:hypothetical protein n=1 Tax=unclassified Saccharopolyspora TaxID=2646250 RepID=UPI001CD4EEE0|nr:MULTISPECIES: hypothetical protein [unclassified Saccharopolyspora]MCA1188131.1 hypothetical protein [Saccharopolyspora sp. 6T]MCA1280654.1 hypothetical protein [Saccharopolyspora sp. 7B]
MRAFLLACWNIARDVACGVDAAHAIEHGATPAPQPAPLVVRDRRPRLVVRPRVRRPVGGGLSMAR